MKRTIRLKEYGDEGDDWSISGDEGTEAVKQGLGGRLLGWMRFALSF